MFLHRKTSTLPTPAQALPGRPTRPYEVGQRHAVLGTPLEGSVPDGHEVAVFGFGCFWGAEREFWQLPGVWSTSAGYAGGSTPNPTYEEVCGGRTGHTEVVRVVFDPAVVSYPDLLTVFWEAHDPTQGMRQGNDVGTQYRSAIYVSGDEQREQAETALAAYGEKLAEAGYGKVTTEVEPLADYWFAEDYHQQYLQKNPYGYCPIHATGIEYADA